MNENRNGVQEAQILIRHIHDRFWLSQKLLDMVKQSM